MVHDRERLVRRIREHLEGRGYPRLEMFVIVALAGTAAFIVSFALLSAGVTSMPVRYAVAGSAAYVAFLSLLGAYIAWKRRLEGNIDAIDLADAVRINPSLPGGGSEWTATNTPESSSVADGSWFDGFDDLGWVVLACAALVAGFIAVGSIVWMAPALLAEVLVDALIVSTISHRLGHIEKRDWTMTAIRRTWIPAAVVILTMVVGGWALQQMAPDAESIGPAVRGLASR